WRRTAWRPGPRRPVAVVTLQGAACVGTCESHSSRSNPSKGNDVVQDVVDADGFGAGVDQERREALAVKELHVLRVVVRLRRNRGDHEPSRQANGSAR